MRNPLAGGNPILPLATLALAIPFSAAAQPSPSAGPTPSYGTASASHVHIGYGEFAQENSTDGFTLSVGADHFGRRPTTVAGFDAHPRLPTGALLDSLRIDFCDTNATQHAHFNLLACNVLGAQCNNLASVASSPPAVGNCGSKTVDLSVAAYTVQNESQQLILVTNLEATDGSNVLLGADLGYKLQVSPAPAVATFSDVPTSSPQFKFVEALVAAGITAGCGGGNYCPTQPVTRGQMAVFLSVALGLHFPN